MDRSVLDRSLLDHRQLVVSKTATAEPAGRSGREPDDRPRVAPSRVNRVIACTAVLGTVAAAVACFAWSGRTTPPVAVSMSTPWLAVILLAVTSLAEFTAVRLRHGDEIEALTLLEAAMVADILLLPPSVATIVAILGLAVASALDRRRAIIKTVFNLGSHATGTALLVTIVSSTSKAGSGLSGPMVAALLVGTLVFAALNLALLSCVISAAGGPPARETITDSWRLSLVMAIGTCGIGAVAVGVLNSAPFLLPFVLLPAAALTYAYRAAAQEASERERSGRLVALTQVLAGRLVADDLLDTFLGQLREAFSASSARVVLEGDDQSAGAVVLCDEVGLEHSSLTAFDAALLASAGSTAELVTSGLPVGWGRALIAPLEAEGGRMGVLVLVTEARSGLKDRDLAILGPLVSALAVALRGAEHLSRLVEETGKLQAVVDHSSDGILVLDGESRVQVWSPSMQTLSGLPASLVAGRPLAELVRAHPVDPSTETHPLDEAGVPLRPIAPDLLDVTLLGLTPDEPRRTVEIALIRPDGEERWVRMSHTAVFESGVLTQDVVLVYDVTRERQVERLKSDFIATVSHELRTPITPIKGYVELLRRRGDDMEPAKRREMLDTVADRVSHLARLVEDLLLASGVSAPSASVLMQTSDLAALTRRSVDDFPGEANRISTSAPEHPVVVKADPTRVIQVLSNMISNGLKYSPAGTPVDIRLELDETARTATVLVRDQGRGIPADQLARVFDKFHRVEDPLRMTTSGTGLGLFIAQQLTGAMGGTLTVESTLGQGATFAFCLPLAPAGTAPAGAPGEVGLPGLPPARSGPPPFGLPGPRIRPKKRPPVAPGDNQDQLTHSG
jgi:signal transduction histidine kinase